MKDDGFLRWFAERGIQLIWPGLILVALTLGVLVFGQRVLRRTAALFERPVAQVDTEATPTEGNATPTTEPSPTPTETPIPTETPSPTPAPTPYARAGADGVNVRSGPNTSYELLGFLDANTEVPIIGRDGEWWQITYQGASGWIYGPLVAAFNAEQVTGTAVP